jgi:heat shock protein HslJ
MEASVMRSLMAVVGALFLNGAVAAAGLQGSEWKPVALGNMLLTDETTAFIQFRSKGRLVGSGGCNRLMAEYSVSGRHIFIGPVAGTRMYCGEEQMGVEANLISALEQARTFETPSRSASCIRCPAPWRSARRRSRTSC